MNENSHALNAAAITVKGSVFLSRDFLDLDRYLKSSRQVAVLKGESKVCFKAYGEVSLVGATIGGNLECNNGQFINPDGFAIIADSVHVKGNVYLNNGFRADGEVSLHEGNIGGNLECDYSQFTKSKEYAINAYRLKVKSSVLFRKNVKIIGEVRFHGASIEDMYWTGITSTREVKLNLESAKISTLFDDANSWPEKDNLVLRGLTYDEINEGGSLTVQDRIRWLHRQPNKPFYSQPYEQLASMLRRMGKEEDARQVLIEKNRDRARYSQMSFSELWWHRILGCVIGYGYRPFRALFWSFGLIALGWVIFGMGFCADVMTPTKRNFYVPINTEPGLVLSDPPKAFILESLVYSIDLFVPIINLHVANDWEPGRNRKGLLSVSEKIKIPVSGNLMRVYTWFHIILGWFFTTFLVVGLTGLIRS